MVQCIIDLIKSIFFIAFYLGVCQAQNSISGTIPYQGEIASGQYEIFRRQLSNPSQPTSISVNNAKHIFLFVEGFDPNQEFDINFFRTYSYSRFAFGNILGTYDYDICVLDFDDGGDYIQKNAYLLVELIRELNANRNTSYNLVIGGFSMGGVVARYALSYMESIGEDHQVGTFISLDAPQKGAVIPIGMQYMVRSLESLPGADVNPDFQKALNQINARAAKQMLRYFADEGQTNNTNLNNYNGSSAIYYGEVPFNPDFLSFYSELESLNGCKGMPQNCRNVAISFGNLNAIPQEFNRDLDEDGSNDFQQAGVPVLTINSDNSMENDWVWALRNTCTSVWLGTFQQWISTTANADYPHLNQRASNFGSNLNYTFLMNDGPYSPLPPNGRYASLDFYESGQAEDFAPGGYLELYRDVGNAIGDLIDCTDIFADRATFIPVSSALLLSENNFFPLLSNNPISAFDQYYVTTSNFDHSNPLLSGAVKNAIYSEIGYLNNGGIATNNCINTIQNFSNETFDNEHAIFGQISVSEISMDNSIFAHLEPKSISAGKRITLKGSISINGQIPLKLFIEECNRRPCSFDFENQIESVQVSNMSEYSAKSSLDYSFSDNSSIQNDEDNNNNSDPEFNMDIFPNPASTQLTIQAQEKVQIQIKSTSGKTVETTTIFNSGTLDISTLPVGIYFVEIHGQNGQHTSKKLLIQR